MRKKEAGLQPGGGQGTARIQRILLTSSDKNFFPSKKRGKTGVAVDLEDKKKWASDTRGGRGK